MILRGRAGYQLNSSLTVEDQSCNEPTAEAKDEGDGPVERQEWIVEELKKGRRLRRCDLENQFGISTATAKRDFGDLAERVKFIGNGKAGHYALSARSR